MQNKIWNWKSVDWDQDWKEKKFKNIIYKMEDTLIVGAYLYLTQVISRNLEARNLAIYWNI